MSKNPFINAFAALAYIALVASFMFYGTKNMGHADTVFAPIAFLSVFSLSAAAMAFIFFYQPFQLYFDGKKKEALNLVLKTVLTFGGITVVLLILLMSRVIG